MYYFKCIRRTTCQEEETIGRGEDGQGRTMGEVIYKNENGIMKPILSPATKINGRKRKTQSVNLYVVGSQSQTQLYKL